MRLKLGLNLKLSHEHLVEIVQIGNNPLLERNRLYVKLSRLFLFIQTSRMRCPCLRVSHNRCERLLAVRHHRIRRVTAD